MKAVAYSYLRFSSPQQATGDSIRRQVEATTSWCQRNNVALDESIKLRDNGVSAFKGAHRNNPDVHALAGFLNAVKSGRVPSGSFLIVESLDRLTREELGEAVELVLSLVNRGVKIVQLQPIESVLQKPVDITALVLAVVELSRGHSESKMKSERVGAAWARKQKEAATRVVTRRLPGWIDYVDGKLVLNSTKAAVVRRLFSMAHDGMGVFVISKKLNTENVPVIGRTHFKGRPMEWCQTSIYAILKSRATIGDYVPYKCRGEGRKPQGEPVPGYFPPVIDEATFYAVQKGLETRGKVRGKRGKHVNMFAGLLTDARNGGSLTYRHPKGKPSQLVPVDSNNGRTGEWVSFPAAAFEACILSQLVEVKASDIEGAGDGAREVEVASGKLSETEELIRLWEAKMDDPKIVDTVAAKLAGLNVLRRERTEALAEAQRKAASPISEAWGEFRTLADVIASDNSDELRVRIRSALRRAVESVTCLFVGKSGFRLCAARVQFVTGAHRDYVIRTLQRYNGREPSPPQVMSANWPTEAGEIDLRKRADARLVEGVLEELDVDRFGR
ncbi:resolvase domain-containing protein : Recombinase OS=Nitrobacter hamburgensis (strain X14 / DSM 10229) GN=Nham_0143 PE=4 SV=1: Resolvase: Recombinase [Gemmata massiliana]|uniref:Resolvase/invertase-type recombinase catalytic domain-containing protein n=1 Tax=Gemmata massiliana TaxID=1210884 RepID=A0A6P2DK98_9BACT|nr:recombinase family protein [Gemmata massiliana]VTS03785.1 resolvase domain-containing protein : Recombinase OS=Nitrobacter hamburgensis (strain X14 / DSM 10229) GN=Nham_0143 PE=4 SV=1: Resolvase: Recombinase [Gemmata massiliana]